MPFVISKSVNLDGVANHIFRESRSSQPIGKVSNKPLPCPFSIAVDTREQVNWEFDSLRADSSRSYRPLIIPTIRTTLHQGDYSIVGLESGPSSIAIERKSKADLYGTISAGRERFEAELQRFSELVTWSAVIVEADWESLQKPPEFSRYSPKSLEGAVLAFMVRYPKVHWMFMPGRCEAERVCFKVLERWWKDVKGGKVSNGGGAAVETGAADQQQQGEGDTA